MANEAYIKTGTAYLLNGEAGATEPFSVEGISASTGRVSDQLDLGASPRPFMYDWSCEVQWQATPTQYGTLDIYIATAPDADATQIDGDIGNTDATLADVDQLENLKKIGRVVSENAAANEKCVASGSIMLTNRYVQIVVFNNGGATINATDSNFRFDLVAKSVQGQ